MANRKNNDTEAVRLYILELINEEQSKHSRLVADIKLVIGGTKEFDDTVRVLNQIYDAKNKLLQRILNEIRTL